MMLLLLSKNIDVFLLQEEYNMIGAKCVKTIKRIVRGDKVDACKYCTRGLETMFPVLEGSFVANVFEL